MWCRSHTLLPVVDMVAQLKTFLWDLDAHVGIMLCRYGDSLPCSPCAMQQLTIIQPRQPHEPAHTGALHVQALLCAAADRMCLWGPVMLHSKWRHTPVQQHTIPVCIHHQHVPRGCAQHQVLVQLPCREVQNRGGTVVRAYATQKTDGAD